MRRKLLIGLGAVIGVFGCALAGVVGFAKAKGDPVFELPATGLKASADPAVIAEGEYLFHGPMHCTACHDTSKEAAFARKAGEKVEPLGGMVWEMGPMGRPVSANLTSDPATGIGAKSDEHLARVIKYGVGDDGKLRLFMALAVATVTDRELVALLSYLRTLPPREHRVEAEQSGLLGELLVALGKISPRTRAPVPYVAAAEGPTVERGSYLANGPALCAACHSPMDFLDGMALKGDLFSGCFEPEPGHEDTTLEICPPNLTPHPTAGFITSWTEDVFVARFKSGASTSKESPMPWTNFSNMTDDDLRSIYRYLRTLPQSARNPGPPVRKAGSFTMPPPPAGTPAPVQAR